MPYLQTLRLDFVEPSLPEHFSFLRSIFSDADLLQHISGGQIFSEEQFGKWMSWMREHWQKHHFGPALLYERKTQRPIGIAGLKYMEVEKQSLVDLGCMIVAEFQKKGLAFEVAQCLLQHGFHGHRFTEIYANTHPQNLTAQHLLQKMDFQFLKIIHREMIGLGLSEQQLWVHRSSANE